MKAPKPIKPADFPTGDQTKRCAGDQLLRQHGFTIRSRPRCGPVMWERGGVFVTDEVARSIAEREPAPVE